jgi:hypothetical protein
MPDLVIRFINERGIISRLIDWETDSLFCHTEGLSRDGQAWVGAHAHTGVQARPLDWCKPIFERRYAVPVSDENYESAMQFMESKIGLLSYDYVDIIGLALHARIGASDHEIICSAFMLLWLQAAGLAVLNVLPEYSFLCTPETLHLSPIFIGRGIPIT